MPWWLPYDIWLPWPWSLTISYYLTMWHWHQTKSGGNDGSLVYLSILGYNLVIGLRPAGVSSCSYYIYRYPCTLASRWHPPPKMNHYHLQHTNISTFSSTTIHHHHSDPFLVEAAKVEKCTARPSHLGAKVEKCTAAPRYAEVEGHLTIQPHLIMINCFHQVLYCTLQSVIYIPVKTTLSLSVFLNLIICLIFNHQMPKGELELGQILTTKQNRERESKL